MIDALRRRHWPLESEPRPKVSVSPALLVFLVVLDAAAVVVGWRTISVSHTDWATLIFGAALIGSLNATSASVVSDANTRWSAAGFIHLAQAVVLGPIAAACNAVAGSAGNIVRYRPGPARTAFNIPMHFLKDVAAWAVYVNVSNGRSSLMGHVGAGVLAGLTQFAVNVVLLSVVIGLTDPNRNLFLFARQTTQLFLPYNLGYGWSVYGAVILHNYAGLLGMTFIVFPVLLAQFFLIGLAQSVAQRETAREQYDADREQLNRRITGASDAERRRIVRDLHDGVVQDLSVLASGLRTHAEGTQVDPQTRDLVLRAGDAAAAATDELRTLLHAFTPPDLTEIGLSGAVAQAAEPLRGLGIEVTVDIAPELETSDLNAALFRISQEALRNAGKHSGANSLSVVASVENETAVLRVVDDGCGFAPDQARAKHDDGHVGLLLMNDLAAECEGTLTVTSSPGNGTCIEVRAPLRVGAARN